tara:strand:- start:316 stop:699 length:384 start_codon:yes stop_codon:yes gene_type:complete
MIDNWDAYPNFGRDEFACSHCGDEDMDAEFVQALQELRIAFGKGMTITSGYRCPAHPIEAKKRSGPGTHASGKAADISVSRADAVRLLRYAMMDGRFTGFGIKQKGKARFIHLDSTTTTNRPTIWSY